MPAPPAPDAATGRPTGSRWRRTLRRAALATGLAFSTVLVFAVALAVTMPASVLGSLVTLPPQVEALSGSTWRGRASLTGGYVVAWTVSPRDLWRLRIVADVTVEGPDTLLAGELAATPWRAAALGWTGRAGPGLLLLAPRIPVAACTGRATLDVALLALGRSRAAASGRVDVGEGTCRLPSGREIPVPRMAVDLATEGRDAVLRLSQASGAPLGRLTVAGSRLLDLRVEPAGAALVPGLPSSAPIEIQVPF